MLGLSSQISMKKPTGNLTEIASNLYINLGMIDITMMFHLPNNEQRMSLYLFRSPLISPKMFCSFQPVGLIDLSLGCRFFFVLL